MFKQWLTREERRLLSHREEAALRRQRKAEAGVQTLFPALRWPIFEGLADSLISSIAPAEDIIGRDKLDAVVSRLMDDADTFVRWEWLRAAFPGPLGVMLSLAAEAGDGPILHLMVEPQIRRAVQRVYDDWPG